MADQQPDTTATPEILAAAAQMTTDAALGAIEYCEIGSSPAVALHALLARREAVVDRLLAVISRPQAEISTAYDSSPDDRRGYFGHTFAIYLLAYWQEPRAFAPLVSYLDADTATAMEHLQETVTEDLHAILARLYDGGDLGPLKRIIESSGVDPFVRDACLQSLYGMVLLGKLPRQRVVDYYAHVLESLRGDRETEMADGLLTTAALLQEPALRPAIDLWFKASLADPLQVRRKDIDETYRADRAEIDEEMLMTERFESLVDYLAGWDWFHATDPAEFVVPDQDETATSADEAARQPFVRETPKVGRNDPCPCGSGQKFKKCCRVGDSA